MRSLIHSVSVLALLAPASGCLEVTEQQPVDEPMCEIDADCDTDQGEVCDLGICWGGPPADTQFAAILVPPDDRTELVPTEIPHLGIAPDGSVGGLNFVRPRTLSGRVTLACEDTTSCDPSTSVSARITVGRPAAIRGGPGYTRTTVTESGVREGPAFTLRVPPTTEGDEPYQVTITPDDGGVEGDERPSPAALAPPMRFSLDVTQDITGIEWVLGDPADLKIVRGRVVDAAGRGMGGMQVSALGRWSALDDLERASSIATTDAEGWFDLRIPIAMLDVFDLVVTPGPDVQAPKLRKRDVTIPDPLPGEELVAIDALRMPSFAEPTTFVVPVRGYDGSGELQAVTGAEVRMTTILLDELDTIATYSTTAFSDADGEARLDLIPGGGLENRLYAARVVPPAGSEHASLFDVALSVGLPNPDGASWLPALELDNRVALTSRVVDAEGEPVSGATVSIQPSLSFKWNLDEDAQTTIANLPQPSVITDEQGVFLAWVDPLLVGHTAVYDIEIAPPNGSAAPRWRVEAEEIPASDGSTHTLDDIELPHGAFARGPVRAPEGEPVPVAEVRLYELIEDDSLCAADNIPGGADDCVPPAILRGIWQARADGSVWMVVPDPE